MDSQIIECSWLTLTRGCQARCNWCYAQGAGYDRKKQMPLQLARKLIDITSDSGAASIVLIGGEPTIYNDFFEVIKYVQSKKMKPTIVTNGFLLAEAKFTEKIKKAGVEELIISVKSFDNENYKKVTGVNQGMSLVEKAVKNCKEYKIGVTFTVTISNDFIENADSFLKTLLLFEPRYLDFGLAVPVILNGEMSASYIPDPKLLASTVKQVHEILKPKGVGYGFELNIPFCLVDRSTLNELMKEQKVSRACHIPNGSALVWNEEGCVLPCNFFTSHFLGKFGVEFSTSEEFKSYWTSEECVAFRKRFMFYPHKKCESCKMWSICGGGCVIRWLHWMPENYIPGLAISG